ncbi:MAG: Hsp20/alpha crystallin family protein [Cyanobacteria bacterium P01_H01_bin.74]
MTRRPLTRVKSDLNSIFDEMDTLLKPILASSHPEIHEHLNAWYPAVDLVEYDNHVLLKAAIPGYRPEDISVEVEGNTISLSGESRPVNAEDKASRYLMREMVAGRFNRKLQLAFDLVAEEAKAEFKNGILTITLPKAVQAKKLKIDII